MEESARAAIANSSGMAKKVIFECRSKNSSALYRQFTNLVSYKSEPVDVHQAAVGNLEMRDHWQGNESKL